MNKKLNIMKAKPPVTDDEIKSYMNFNEVMLKHNQQLKHALTLKRAFVIVSSACLLVAGTWLIIHEPSSTEISDKLPSPWKATLTDSIDSVQKVKETPSDKPSEQSKTENNKSLTTASKKKLTAIETITDSVSAIVQKNDYHEAEPLDGYPHLYEYFNKELRYPKQAIKDSIQGTVSVSFIINTTGKPGDIVIQNSLGAMFDEETIRLITYMPAWKPAQLNGKSVPAKISMPLTFSIIKTTVKN